MKIESEPLRLGWKITHNTVAIILLVIMVLYYVELRLTDFKSYADIVSVVPTKEEFEGDENINFHIFAKNATSDLEPSDIDVRQVLMCDTGTASGYFPVSSEVSTISTNNLTQSIAAAEIIQNDVELLSYMQISGKLRKIARSNQETNTPSATYPGELPPTTAECFVRFEFSTKTPKFGINKTLNVSSYPFDYVWYFNSNQ